MPGFSREGEKSMSLTELMDASKGLTNMALAHEIAVDKDFSLQKIQPANEVEKQVNRENSHPSSCILDAPGEGDHAEGLLGPAG